jgi:hypothetical protein
MFNLCVPSSLWLHFLSASFGFLDPSCIRFWTSALRRFQLVTPHNFSFIIAILLNSSPLDILCTVAETAFLEKNCLWEGLKLSEAIVFFINLHKNLERNQKYKISCGFSHSHCGSTVFLFCFQTLELHRTQLLPFFYIWVSVHHKFIIYNKPTRLDSGSIAFINNYKYTCNW